MSFRKCMGRVGAIATLLAAGFVAPVGAQTTKTAADIVPADCDFFSTSLMLREQCQSVANSNAVKKILNLPYVQMGLAQVKSQPQYSMAMQLLENPDIKDVVDVLKDGFSTEMFSYGEKGWPALYDIFTDYQQQSFMATITSAMSGKQASPLPAIITAFTKRKDFKFPALVTGFKVTDPKKVGKVLAKLKEVAAKNKFPGKIETRKINGEDFFAYVLAGKDLPIAKEQLVEELGKMEISQFQAETLHEWLSERTLEIAVGRSGDYLVFSFGSDSKHVERLGKGPSLGTSEVLNPLRKHLDKGKLLSLGYSSLAIASIGKTNMKDSVKQVEMLAMPFKGFLPPGLADRILADLNEAAADIDSVATKPSESVSVTLYNRGPESFAYTKTLAPGVDFSRVLNVLNYAGKSPMLAAASSSKSSLGTYKTGVKYLKKVWGYWRDYGVAKLEGEQKDKYKLAEDALLPFFKKIDAALVNKLLPATDGGQALFVIDTKARIKSLGPDVHFDKPMPMLEIGFGATLNDGKQFKEAVSDIAAAIEEVVPKLAKLDPNAPEWTKGFKIQRPNVKALAGGDMYFYPLPPIVDPAVLPHAYVGDKLFIAGTSPAMTERMVKEGSAPRSDIVNLSEPSGTGVMIDTADFWTAVKEWVSFAADKPNSPIAPKNAEGVMNRQALDAGLELFGVFKSASMRTFREGDYTVTHSWSHFEDSPN